MANAFDLASAILGPGVTITSATFTGDPQSAAVFSASDPSPGIGIASGIVLSTGNVADIYGPNDSDNTSTDFPTAGDVDLDALVTPSATQDAAVLEFDFVPKANFLMFNYVFVSEEYNEWGGSPFNDVFGFFVTDPAGVTTNIAVIPGTTTPIAVNNVNSSTNPAYYLNNDPTDFGVSTTPYNTEFDGFTTGLTAAIQVIPGEIYKFKLAIADNSDGVYDSAVFITNESFVSLPLVPVTDSFLVSSDSPTSLDVLDNDLALEGEQLFIENFESLSSNGGTVALDENQTPEDPVDDNLIYTPPSDFSGLDSFKYTIADSSGNTATGTVYIQVDNATPPTNNAPVFVTSDNSRIYWINQTTNTVQSSNLDGSDLQNIISSTSFQQIEVDYGSGKIYMAGLGGIQQVDLDGGNRIVLVTNPVADITLDLTNGKLYYLSSGPVISDNTIHRINLDGSAPELLFESQVNDPIARAIDLAVDSVNGYIYWTMTNGENTIRRASLEGYGSDQEVVFDGTTVGNYSLREIEVDPINGKIYWTSNDFNHGISRANLDGSNFEVMVPSVGLAMGFDIDPLNGKMYWANGDNSLPESEGSLQRANLDGTELETLIPDLNITSFIDLPSLSLAMSPTPTGTLAFDVPENSILVGTVIATDPENMPVIYSLSGSDAQWFNIDSSTGTITFKTQPDFENPLDMGADNTYNVTAVASDGELSSYQDVVIKVLNEEDSPSVLQVRINLLADNDGTPGEILANDQVGLNRSFFVQIQVGDFRGNAAGLVGLNLNFAWDGFILESINFDPFLDITPSFPLLQDGTLAYDGLIDNLSGGSLPEFEFGQAIGVNQLDTFALLHFRADSLSDGTTYFTTTVNEASFADDYAFNAASLDVEQQPIQVLSAYGQYNFTYYYGNGDSYTGYVYAAEGTYTEGQVLGGYSNETGNEGYYEIGSIAATTLDSNFNNRVYVTSYNDVDTGFGETTNIGEDWWTADGIHGYSGLGSESGYAYDAEGNSVDPSFSNYSEADILNQYYTYTYTYGNGDSYKGYGYALAGTYVEGQTLEGYSNETGFSGYYVIDSVELGNTNAGYNGYVYITSYFDGDTGFGETTNIGEDWWTADGIHGYSGLGSESGYAYDAEGNSVDPSFSNSAEADILGNQLYNFTYYYGNGDSYKGYGYAAVGTYVEGQTLEGYSNETGFSGYYVIDSVELGNTNAGYNGQVYVTSYTDDDTEFGTTTNLYNYGNPATYSGLGNEASYAYDADGNSADPYFSNYSEADILNQYYEFTYTYGNGDSYSGHGYALAGTYVEGQTLEGYSNETGYSGYYTINSVEAGTTNSSDNNRVYVTSYTDADTGFGTTTNIGEDGWTADGIHGYSGLGSESGYAYDADGNSSDPLFSSFYEADIYSIPTLSIQPTDAIKAEGNSGLIYFTFTVSRTGSLFYSSSVDWSVMGSGAQSASPDDFGSGSYPQGTLDFAPGQDTATIIVEVNGDITSEMDESFSVTLSNAVDAVLDTSSIAADGVILNDDLSSLAITDNSGNANDSSIKFTTQFPLRQNYTESDWVRPNFADTTKYFDITNTGTGILQVSDIVSNVAGVTTNFVDDLLINPGESQRIQLSYDPSAAGENFSVADGLVLFTNDLNLPQYAIALNGKSTFNSDINYDGKVGAGDLGPLNNASKNFKNGIYDPTADIDGNGLINSADLTVLLSENKLSLV